MERDPGHPILGRGPSRFSEANRVQSRDFPLDFPLPCLITGEYQHFPWQDCLDFFFESEPGILSPLGGYSDIF